MYEQIKELLASYGITNEVIVIDAVTHQQLVTALTSNNIKSVSLDSGDLVIQFKEMP